MRFDRRWSSRRLCATYGRLPAVFMRIASVWLNFYWLFSICFSPKSPQDGRWSVSPMVAARFAMAFELPFPCRRLSMVPRSAQCRFATESRCRTATTFNESLQNLYQFAFSGLANRGFATAPRPSMDYIFFKLNVTLSKRLHARRRRHTGRRYGPSGNRPMSRAVRP